MYFSFRVSRGVINSVQVFALLLASRLLDDVITEKTQSCRFDVKSSARRGIDHLTADFGIVVRVDFLSIRTVAARFRRERSVDASEDPSTSFQRV